MIMGANFTINNFSVVIPIHNEEDIVLDSAEKIYEICNKTNIEFEIIFSENGSNDKTLDLINDYCTRKKECKVISSKIANYGMALKNGFEKAKNEMIISFDIDYFSEQFLIDSISLDKKYSAITASKRLNDSEDGRKLIRRIATNFFVTLLKILFQTSMSDTHGMKAIRKVSLEKQIAKVVSTQDLFDTELLIRIERNLEEIYEVPAMVNEIRPSVSVIYSRIPRTIKSLLKLRIQLFNESLNTKNL
jgi:glycosyltransferase involved in cell wall biosynthesis